MATGRSTASTPAVDDAVVWKMSTNNAYGYTWPSGNPDGDADYVNVVLRFPGQVYYV
jgi:hypothetical protein